MFIAPPLRSQWYGVKLINAPIDVDAIYSWRGQSLEDVGVDARQVPVCLQEFDIAEIHHSITLHSAHAWPWRSGAWWSRVRDGVECDGVECVTEWCNGVVTWKPHRTEQIIRHIHIQNTYNTIQNIWQVDSGACVTICNLGVTINSNLTPSSHIASITVTANQRVNLIYRSFISRDVHLLVRAFTTYVRPILEYNSVAWSPYYKSDIACIEKVQRRFTKLLPNFKSLTYGQRLNSVDLPTLELRRLHADLVMCYKLIFGLVKLSFDDFFSFNPVTVTRGHPYKLFLNHSYGTRKHFFCWAYCCTME